MEPLDGAEDTVHPEVRAHINSLASALGGTSVDDDGQYQLGDDALQVLRDIKRWIRFYDEKTNRMDVARCIYEANLVQGDLLPILAQWPESAMDNKFKSRMALACFEVLVPLTWPMDRDEERMTVNHHRHMPVLELAQLQYKNAIINFDGARILHMAVRAALPSMAISNGDRTARDQGIIKLVLFFLRNVALISPPSNMPDEAQISIVATIDAFSCQDIFIFLLTLASNMGDDFRTEDATVMEIIHHLVKRVEVDRLFMEEQQLNKATASQLSAMMSKESSILNASKRKGPTRHNRFGTMIWVKRDDGKMSSLSGQDALADAATRIQKMDSNKTFKPPRPPRRGKKQQKGARDLGPPVKLKAPVNARLRSFVEEFLDSGFNRLFQHVRKSIDREAPHLMIYHRRQFFRLVAWFLEAEHARRQAQKRGGQQSDSEVGSFNLIAGVLNQEMFITLSRALHESYEMKDWQELAAVMRCFTQILLTVQEMADSGHDDDGEIAENVLGRLFYEEATHDAIANIAKTYKDQGFDYLDAATELVHNFLRILEAYSKQNVDMQVRTRRRTRRKKQAASQAGETAAGEESDGSANDVEKAADNSKDRKFNFRKFSSKFTQQGVVDTFTTWTKHYRDLNDAQLKRAHRYFYRVAFKQEMSVMLFRVDILHLLHSMIRGPEPLDKSSKMFKEWEELVRQILRKCFKKMQERPELIVEMLFSKIPRITSFLEFGHEIQTAKAKREAKPGAELEFRHTEERDRQVAIVIGAMLDRNESDHINWVKGVLTKAESERRSWAAAHEALPPVEDSVEVQDGNGEPTKPPIYCESLDSFPYLASHANTIQWFALTTPPVAQPCLKTRIYASS
ncbi:drug resistance protein MdrA [Ophiocordyceps sinensis CO18]|uniref:Topoisomerase 1-associated factor 1 n=1 Tax=Ophiocordyceps sinensis (strain Co18 / CGMCC 3.14243) TaxID=911162 RepID=T5AB09_OPHSC|nr:drug resistance protein MdrA [Ophiocordyceps sinensis CO18]